MRCFSSNVGKILGYENHSWDPHKPRKQDKRALLPFYPAETTSVTEQSTSVTSTFESPESTTKTSEPSTTATSEASTTVTSAASTTATSDYGEWFIKNIVTYVQDYVWTFSIWLFSCR